LANKSNLIGETAYLAGKGAKEEKTAATNIAAVKALTLRGGYDL
jgi:hypothetical protein